MAEVDSDEELNEVTSSNKPVYTKATRELSSGGAHRNKKIKKLEIEGGGEEADVNADEIEYEDDEEYFKKFAPKELTEVQEEEDMEDMLKMQLQYEKEEAERKAKAATTGGNSVESSTTTSQAKTKVDPDGTEYEWDPVIKGWFPKVLLKRIF